MSPFEVMLWAGAVLVWIGTALVAWVFLEFIADAIKARLDRRADLRAIEGGETDE